MAEERYGGDRRDGGSKDFFELLEKYDQSMQEILQKAGELSESNGDKEKAVASDLERKMIELLETPSLRDYVSKEMKKYFDHDVATFRRGVVDLMELIKNDLDDYLESGEALDKGGFSRRIDSMRKNWEMYRLVVQDLFLRSRAPAGSYSSEQDRSMDRGKSVGRLLEALVFHVSEFCGRGFGELETEFVPDLEELKKIKIVMPHGTIFNFLQNCLANATHHSVGATKFKLKVWVNGDNLLFEFCDNGKGMEEEIKSKIFDEKFTTKKGGKGLGLANAQERFAELGGAVEVVTELNPRPGGQDWATKFVLKIPLVK